MGWGQNIWSLQEISSTVSGPCLKLCYIFIIVHIFTYKTNLLPTRCPAQHYWVGMGPEHTVWSLQEINSTVSGPCLKLSFIFIIVSLLGDMESSFLKKLQVFRKKKHFFCIKPKIGSEMFWPIFNFFRYFVLQLCQIIESVELV